MYVRGVKRLPVVSDDGRLVGIVSRADVLSVYGGADEDIRAQVESDVVLSAGHPETITVAVKDGVVTLDGAAESGEIARQIARRVRHIQGVVAVRDRLSRPSAAPENFDVLASFSID
jgi:CBS-domain-containing membrane protein